MKKEEELELVEFKLNGELQAVSIVSDPAIEKTFRMFNSIKKENFKAAKDKQELTGPVMIPDIAILRINEETGKYYNCFFSEETVKECASIYLKHCNHVMANFEHQNAFTVEIYVIESWIVTDPETDKSKALGFTDIKKGTWFMTYKVDNAELWASIKESGFTGFSIEGFFNHFEAIKNDEHKTKLIYSIINSGLSDSDKEALIKKIIK